MACSVPPTHGEWRERGGGGGTRGRVYIMEKEEGAVRFACARKVFAAFNCDGRSKVRRVPCRPVLGLAIVFRRLRRLVLLNCARRVLRLWFQAALKDCVWIIQLTFLIIELDDEVSGLAVTVGIGMMIFSH